MKPLNAKLKWGMGLGAAMLILGMSTSALACIPGGAVRCAPPGTLDPGAQLGPMTRQDIDALIDLPGPAVTEAVRRDTARTWDTVRRQYLPPVIAYPPDAPHMEGKGGMP